MKTFRQFMESVDDWNMPSEYHEMPFGGSFNEASNTFITQSCWFTRDGKIIPVPPYQHKKVAVSERLTTPKGPKDPEENAQANGHVRVLITPTIKAFSGDKALNIIKALKQTAWPEDTGVSIGIGVKYYQGTIKSAISWLKPQITESTLGYAAWGFVKPDGSVLMGDEDEVPTHSELAKTIGYKNELDAIRHGLVRFAHKLEPDGYRWSVELLDTPKAKDAAFKFLKGRAGQDSVIIDVRGQDMKIAKSREYHQAREALKALRITTETNIGPSSLGAQSDMPE